MIVRLIIALAAVGVPSLAVPPPFQRDIADDVAFFLWTRNNPEDANYYTLVKGDSNNLAASPLDVSLPTYVLVHGFAAAGDGGWPLQGKTAMLELGSYNVIAVDWSKLAEAPWYNIAFASVDQVGAFTASMLDWLHAEVNLDTSTLHLVGHSLGAHVSGSVGRHLASAKLPRITGLDPAGPEFYGQPEENRLDPSDAIFVDVIHTNAGSVLESCVGLELPTGHLDFYPNGGDHQPGCVILGEDWTDLLAGGCSHGRSHDYWVESILALSSAQAFGARPCDSWEEYEQGRCPDCGDACVDMGFHLKPGSVEGLYFLKTNKHSPFAQGNQ
ncbi:inactive pancreatic lipase-related protein 1-like [Penaeus japonicus]|uniref:inactive pancreatic lipase-related protein 1-like n=1 Tax=Penaeus japonicus TaxID=27405 RepID=UPI001C7105A8|nr:inactive pancreatic lipase-related protein 1-like [Penaeus japonicus]